MLKGNIKGDDISSITIFLNEGKFLESFNSFVEELDISKVLKKDGKFEYPIGNNKILSLCNEQLCVPISMNLNDNSENKYVHILVNYIPPNDFPKEKLLVYTINDNNNKTEFDLVALYPARDIGGLIEKTSPMEEGGKIQPFIIKKDRDFKLNLMESDNLIDIQALQDLHISYKNYSNQEHSIKSLDILVCDYSNNCNIEHINVS
jgi:hypothetical protein